MQSIDKLTEELKDAILNSEQYKEYLYYKEQLEKEPQLYELVNSIRRRNFMIQNTAEFSGDDVYNETQKYQKEYRDAKTNEIANKFFLSELTMCRIIQDINYKIIRELDFDIDFLNR